MDQLQPRDVIVENDWKLQRPISAAHIDACLAYAKAGWLRMTDTTKPIDYLFMGEYTSLIIPLLVGIILQLQQPPIDNQE